MFHRQINFDVYSCKGTTFLRHMQIKEDFFLLKVQIGRISYKQTARPLRVALLLYCISIKDYFLAYARLLLSLRTITSLLRSQHLLQLGCC